MIMKKIVLMSIILLMTDHLGAHIIDDLSNPNDRNWVYFTDTVMGGVSKGNLEFKEDKDESYYRLTGFVNTDNNGGFIQFATGVSGVPDKKYQGIRIKVRGNNENYELHIRTRLTPAPWQYYSYKFYATNEWETIELPLESFIKSNFYQPKSFKATNIRSIGIVAIGKDFDAEIDLARIELY
jgi:hypothetical protein|tara:strand:+ start:361 stop:906 length:546 start_codon:yes stop_codon:yes gene_type:complete